MLQQLTRDSLHNERKELELGVGRSEYCVYNCGSWWLFGSPRMMLSGLRP